MVFSDMKSWLMANVNWSSELLKCFSINDKCCWLFCLLWHHKTFQEAASFVQGKREEVAASDDVHSDLLMLWGQAWLQMTLPFLLQSSITSIKHATLLSLKRRACASALSPPPSFSSHQELMTHNLSNSGFPMNSRLTNTIIIGQLHLISQGISN